MRKVIIYIFFMMVVIIILPLIITKCGGTDFSKKETKLESNKKLSKIAVFNSTTKKKMELELEEYVKGVVAAEMPASFELEALKAQAVAARTYVLGRLYKKFIPKINLHPEEVVCTDPGHCQAWIDKKSALAKWSIFTAKANWNRIEDAVNKTAGIVITYKSELINPLYHSCSPGKTEDAKELWDGKDIPYLKSVSSEGDEKCPSYKTLVNFSKQKFVQLVKKAYPDLAEESDRIDKSLKIIKTTIGGRVKEVKFSNIVISGTKAREIFGLASNCFVFEFPHEDEINIVVTGAGHGAGMSQWGANELAIEGGSFDEIIKHYYTGTEINTMEKLKFSY